MAVADWPKPDVLRRQSLRDAGIEAVQHHAPVAVLVDLSASQSA